MKNLLAFLVFLIGLYYALRLFEKNSLYFPDRQILADPKALRIPFEEISLTTRDNVLLHSWHLKHPEAAGRPDQARPLILFCHGNAGNISHRLDKMEILYDLGLDVFIFDYRGYGKSKGSPSEKGTYEDALAAWLHLNEEKKIPAEKIALYGESLGAAVAAHLAAQKKVSAVILEGAFTSTVDMGKEVFPFLPVKWMVSYEYDTLGKIGQVQAPKLILHSPQDDIVPFRMAQKLFEAAQEPKELFKLQGSHNDSFLESGKAYPESIRSFLKKHKIL